MSDEPKKKTKARRGRGEGSIRERKPGLWSGDVSLGSGADGKRMRRTVYGATKAEVMKKMREVMATSAVGKIAPEKITLGGFLDRWITDYVTPNLRATTLDSYARLVRLHIKPRVGHMLLTKVTPPILQGLYAAVPTPRLRELVHAVMHSALKQAVRWRLLEHNPVDSVDKPRGHRRELTVWNEQEALRFLAAIDGDRLEAFYVLALSAGLRLGELLGLHEIDVDLARASVAVRRQLVEIAGKLTLEDVKTRSSRRSVALPDVAVSALREHRRRKAEEGHATAAYVFVDTEGGPLRRSNLRRRSWAPLLERAGVPEIRIHDLRHTSATLLLAQGVHPKVAQERLGHSRIATTMDNYSHVMPNMQREAAAELDAVLKKKG